MSDGDDTPFEYEPTADLDLEPGLDSSNRPFRDSRWRVRWPEEPGSLAAALEQ